MYTYMKQAILISIETQCLGNPIANDILMKLLLVYSVKFKGKKDISKG